MRPLIWEGNVVAVLPDIRSIIFTGLLATVACFFVSIQLWRQSRRNYPGMDLMVLDFAAQVSSLLLILARGTIPDWASVVLANALVFVGSLLGYIGLQRFVGRRTPQAHNWILVSASIAVHAWFSFVQPDLSVRNLNLSLTTLVLWGQCAWLMLAGAERRLRPVTRAVGLVFVAFCVVNAARVLEFLLGPGRTTDFLLSGTFDRLALLAYQTLFIALTFALVLMVNQRLILDVQLHRQRRESLQATLAQSDRLASMGMIAASVAHEINNPLSYVLCNLESLAKELPKLVATASPPLQDALERVRETLGGAQRIQKIARGLGTFSRVESDELVPVDVETCLEHALTISSNELKFRATVVRDLRAVPPVLASEGKLAQVFLNLLINASHAMEAGRADNNELRVSTRLEGDRVRVDIADTGTGIPPELHERLFDPFFTTKPVGTGSGLGLWISRNLVQGFGGDIRFTSEVGKGTRFTVELPPAPRSTKPLSAPIVALPDGASGQRGRVLVVDDEPPIRKIFQRVLGTDHDVLLARSGAAARAILAEDQSFDVILCDLMMPEVSGMDLHRWLSENHPVLAARVVFITGGAFTPGASDYLAKAGNICLEKPFKAPAVKSLIDDLVRTARAAGSPLAG